MLNAIRNVRYFVFDISWVNRELFYSSKVTHCSVTSLLSFIVSLKESVISEFLLGHVSHLATHRYVVGGGNHPAHP